MLKADPPRHEELVVFVDDQPEILDSLRRLLRHEAYELRTTSSPEEALRWVGEGRVSVLVTDERMPSMRGHELLERAARRAPDLVRVVLTGFPGAETRRGADWLISKPWNDEALKLTVRQLIEERRRRPRDLPRSGDFAALCGALRLPLQIADARGTLLWVNRAERELLGYAEEELLGRDAAELHVDPGAAAELSRRAAQGESIRGFDARLRRKDGTVVDVLLDADALRDEDGRLHVGQLARPAEDAGAIERQKLESIGRLSAGIAHEINTPLGYILSNLSTMRDYVDDLTRIAREAAAAVDRLRAGAPPEEALGAFEALRARIDLGYVAEDVGAALQESRQGAERIRDIVKGLRDFAHPGEGAPGDVDLVGCLEAALKLAWNELKYKAEVERELRPLPAWRGGSAQRVKQVFLNLLMQAGEALPKRGVLRLSSAVENGCAVLRIGASGAGTPPEDALGLRVSRRIVTEMGGRLEARSEPGRGSEYAVFVPLDEGGSA